MISIRKNEDNEFVLLLNEDISINNPYFIFRFVDIYNRETIRTLIDDSSSSSYNTFSYYDGSDFSLYASGDYYVYESATDTSIISSLNLLESDKYKLIIDKLDDIIYDPSITYTDYVYDPSKDGVINQDIVFDPIWESGEIPPLGIPASVILQDTNYRFVADGSIAYWNGKADGITEAYFDGSIAAAIDAVDTSLVTYVGDKITDVDSSFGLYETKTNLDSSFGNIYIDNLTDVSIGTTIADGNILQYNVDSSTWDNVDVDDATNYFELKTNIDASFGLYETKVNLDSSFGLYETILNLDGSFALYETILNLDSSFALYETKTNLDSSLSTKLENTTDTFTGILTLDGCLGINIIAPEFTADISGNFRVQSDASVNQSIIGYGLIINNEESSTNIGDFQVKSRNYDAIYVDASEDSVAIMADASGKIGFFGETPSVQSTGWNISNVIENKVYDASNGTLNEVLDVLGTLINELKLKGIIGG